ncbi:hypothetical protein [Paenibacillus sp. V4I5]|uniref:hypothetical protein n=1 Tax=Paenibacillus sp. V4I5 TaxID=3042306 RepID=UPI00279167C3|nr:hypothetical protein [Paenibacillus sp. V4I5]MDQ0917566.1 hypothetical protein [Paenibacillus sp. V4I5]
MHTTFGSLNSNMMGSLIQNAKKRIVYLAPSISKDLAEAIVARKSNVAVIEVIIDSDPEVFRLGYGEIEGIETLVKGGMTIRKTSPLRIGILIVDYQAWIFSSTALIIEEAPKENTLNSIAVNPSQVQALINSVLSENKRDDFIQLSILEDEPEISQEKFTTQDLFKTKKDLNNRPAKQFDKEREVRVYSSYFQFVELKVSGIQINRRTVKIPTKLINAQNNKAIEDKLRTTYRLIDQDSKLPSGKIEDRIKELRKKYIKSLGDGQGTIILMNLKQEFQEEVDKLKKEIEKLMKESKNKLGKYLEKTKKDLIELLLPTVISSPPEDLRTGITTRKPTKEQAKKYLDDELDYVIPNVEEFLEEMDIQCDFKDVTYEMLNNTDFQNKLKALYPYVDWPKPYSEINTIQEKVFSRK